MKSKVGNIRQKANGKWLAEVASGTRADGSIRRVSKTFDTRADAERWCVTQAVEMGRRPDLGAGVTLAAVWDLFVADKGKRLAKKTISAYASLMRVHWLPVMGDTDITAITCAGIQRRIDSMTRENARHAISCLSSVLTYAVGRELLAANPMRGHSFDIPAKAERQEDFEDDPFAVIEERREVWDARTALRCLELIEGLPLEPCWLACIGGGLRVEESLALRPVDVRRVQVGDHMVTQLAVHAARTPMDGTKSTKTRQSVRVVPMLEPFGTRYWEIVSAISDRKALVCPASANRQNRAWRRYFEPPTISKHLGKIAKQRRGRLQELPYIPLSKMRNSHVTLMQEAGVSDSINALMHGHSESIERRHYMRPDTTGAAVDASERLRLVQ